MSKITYSLRRVAKELETAAGNWDKRWWDAEFRKPITKEYTISLCTTNMNRMLDSQHTLIDNIEKNKGYPKVEFLLLDYNSSDGLGDWVKSDLMRYIEDGVLSYYRTEEPKYYQLAHSKNLAFKLGSGDIVMNVDADNYLPENFAEKLNKIANHVDERPVFVGSTHKIRGMLGFYKDDFINILGGYSEDIYGYGPCDRDLYNRAVLSDFIISYFGGHDRILKSETYIHPDRTANFPKEIQDMGFNMSMKVNRLKCACNLFLGKFKANEGRMWGVGKVTKNFGATYEVL